jgi:hypothetical protein
MAVTEADIAFRAEVLKWVRLWWSSDLINLWFNETEPHPLASADDLGFPAQPMTRLRIVENARARFGPRGANIAVDSPLLRLH